jgi:hypothetical protein
MRGRDSLVLAVAGLEGRAMGGPDEHSAGLFSYASCKVRPAGLGVHRYGRSGQLSTGPASAATDIAASVNMRPRHNTVEVAAPGCTKNPRKVVCRRKYL